MTITDSGSGGTDPDAVENLFVPVLLTAAGRNNSFFTSELTLTNRGSEPAILNYTYTTHPGDKSYTATDMLGPLQQKIEPDAIDYLRRLEVPIPERGSQVGTLKVDVTGSSEVAVVVRTTTAVPEGRAGLAYLGIPGHEGFQDEAVYLCGLRQNQQDRSNVALQNMGGEGEITLRTTVFSGNAADTIGRMLEDQTLGPGEFHQFNAVMADKGDPMFASAVEGDLSGIVVGARTGSQGVSGHYSVFYNAVPFGESFTETAWVDALQQNEENRSNLALVNTGEVDDSDSVFSLDIYDGETGRLVNTVTGRRVAPGAWYQINSILGNYAPDTTQGYVRIRRISGNNPFLAYGVVNDGGAPGQRSSDGAYLPARR